MSLIDAVKKGDVEECKRLIKKRKGVFGYPFGDHMSPLEIAILYDNKEMISLLKEHEVTTLSYAIHSLQNIDCDTTCEQLEFILKKFKVDLNDEEYFSNKSPLHTAIKSNSVKWVKFFLKKGTDPFIISKCPTGEYGSEYENLTAVDYAIKNPNIDIIEAISIAIVEKNIKFRAFLPLAHEYDTGSLFHRDYLPKDMFKLIFSHLRFKFYENYGEMYAVREENLEEK